MRTTSLIRDDEELARFTVRKDGFVYIYRRFSDRWDIIKLKKATVIRLHQAGVTSDQILEKAPVAYRITDGGSCSCPGYAYRRDCAHRDMVQGWVLGR